MGSIKPKKGKCLDCPEDSPDKYLIAERCEPHYWIYRKKVNANKIDELEKKQFEKKIYTISKFSEKRKKENPKYTVKRLQFLSQPENLQCFIEGCNNRADTIEHTRGRKGYADEWARDNDITLYLDVRFWMPCCNFHNLELERNSELSEKYQVSKISGKKKIIKK